MDQLTLQEAIIIPEFIVCDFHGELNPSAWYDDDEMIDMLLEQGYIDCPECLEDIDGSQG